MQNDNLYCQECNLRFDSLNDMIEHTITKHPIKSSYTQCNWCEKSFLTEDSLVNHVVKYHT